MRHPFLGLPPLPVLVQRPPVRDRRRLLPRSLPVGKEPHVSDAIVKGIHGRSQTGEAQRTLLFGSIRLNIGAFFSISGMIMNLHSNRVCEVPVHKRRTPLLPCLASWRNLLSPCGLQMLNRMHLIRLPRMNM